MSPTQQCLHISIWTPRAEGQKLDGRVVVVVVKLGSFVRRADGQVDDRQGGDRDEGVEKDTLLEEPVEAHQVLDLAGS